MRPLTGVVTNVAGRTLVIKTESGLHISAPKTGSIGYGDSVLVYYNFTTNTVVEILPNNPDEEVREVDLDEPAEQEELPDLLEPEDWGALRQEGDEVGVTDPWEHWD